MPQAIDIAKQYVQNYSYTLDNGLTVKGFNVTSIQAGLNTNPRENSTTIYPYWSVQLNLDKVYPGNVWQLSVGIWADSGTVFLCQPIGFGGSPPAATPEQTQSQPQSLISPIDLSIVAGTIATIVAIAVIIVKKRSK
jgi:hypothetical protein